MPSILSVPENPDSDTLEVTLDKEGLVIDQRVISFDTCGVRFECTIEKRKLTLRIIAGNEHFRMIGRYEGYEIIGWHIPLRFRLYDPEVEKIPSFKSSDAYMYHGIMGWKVKGHRLM